LLYCRIRPQNAQERIDQSSVVTFCPPEEPQIVFGDKKVFTFDFVFDVETMQSTFYNVAVQKLIKGYVIYMRTPVVYVYVFVCVCVCVCISVYCKCVDVFVCEGEYVWVHAYMHIQYVLYLSNYVLLLEKVKS